jgi:thymidylate kinase
MSLPVIVCLEGINGAGKTTLAGALVNRWQANMPGGASQADPLKVTSFARRIRNAVMTTSNLPADAEALAFTSARLHTAARLSRPTPGDLVLVERWAGAVVAYGAAAGTNSALLGELEATLSTALRADCTLLLDLPAAVACGRLTSAPSLNRFETAGTGYLERVRLQYQIWAAASKATILDATMSPQHLASAAIGVITPLIAPPAEEQTE